MKIKNIRIFIVILCIGCKDINADKKNIDIYNGSQQSFKDYENDPKLKKLQEKILTHGDIFAYKELESIYSISGHQNEFLYYSLHMAEEHNYPKAYYSTYFYLISDTTNKKVATINKLATFYLLKAYELNDINAKYDVDNLYHNKNIPSADEYWISIRD